VYKLKLEFKVPAVTSRNIFQEKTFYYLFVSDSRGKTGLGECAPLEGLSPETPAQVENMLEELCENVGLWQSYILDEGLNGFSSVRMAMETALLDLYNGGVGISFPSKFTLGADKIPINGLIWMASSDLMLSQVDYKVKQGYKIVKLKIGSLDFEQEIDMLRRIREKYPSHLLEIRLDANGAFSHKDVLDKLEKLSEFTIHSIEQPIKPGDIDLLADICEESLIPVALDEELIGWESRTDKEYLLERVMPHYIILKPTLCGGFQSATEWSDLAEQFHIGWWATSALESNIGLSAIAQWVYVQQNPMVHGLGTGQLFTENIVTPVVLEDTFICWKPGLKPDYSIIYEKGERLL